MVSTYTFSDNLTDLRENIQLKSDQGLSLIDIDYIDDPKDKGLVGEEEIWVAEFGYVPGNTIYIFNKSEDIFIEKTNQKTNNGYDLVDIEYADGVWFGILTDSPGNKAITLSGNLDAFAGQIQEGWDNSYQLTNAEYVDGLWSGFYSTPSSLSKNAYVYRATIDQFTGQIEQKWDENFDLVNVEYGDGKWFGVFTQTPESSAYIFSANIDEFIEESTTYEENGFYLSDLEYGDGFLFGVYETDQYDPITTGEIGKQNTLISASLTNWTLFNQYLL